MMQSMILQGIEMPLRIENQNEDKKANQIVEKICNILQEIETTGTNLVISDQVNVYDACPECGFDRPYYMFAISGGLNGRGIWSNYFSTLSSLMLKLEAEFEDAWVSRLNVDCTDDVFDAEIGIYPYI